MRRLRLLAIHSNKHQRANAVANICDGLTVNRVHFLKEAYVEPNPFKIRM